MKGFISEEKVKKAVQEICAEAILLSEKINLSDLLDEISEQYDMYQGISYNELVSNLVNLFKQLECEDISEFEERIKDFPTETKKALILFFENN